MNKPKKIGTAFETAIVNYLRQVTGDERIERRALHGSKDLGDIGPVFAHGYRGIIEAKAVQEITPKLLEAYKAQTIDERDNDDADFGLLVCAAHGCNRSDGHAPSFGRHTVYVTVNDFCKFAFGDDAKCKEKFLETWVSMDLKTAAHLML